MDLENINRQSGVIHRRCICLSSGHMPGLQPQLQVNLPSSFKTLNSVNQKAAGFSSQTSEVSSTLEQEVETKLRDLIRRERVLLLLKGTPEDPRCGFSAAVVNILDKYTTVDYAYVDVLSHEYLRPCAKKIADWPTFPQLFVDGRLVGGCDVIQSLHESGSLAEILIRGEREV
ncbi:hypothetical protein BBBOND_0204220 [Babesia bigemina]|uniref:Glutaredoxin domain-containing protein n=1 Tax=Babesia bigemina TaxID=5866 RepID=A0A061D8M8_BABBI|nr:hypothetical protein BBBOND_0204220 [Babesia bigemina]CDR95264.1 hypothetical protein BBBOND_0204220 [Babesia bigemina]|eukprot:XP_012767450.1 hypothetical protein BBBOND_0204220 [Babesia bigemina]